MSLIFEKLAAHAQELKNILKARAFLVDEQHPFDWENHIFTSGHIRRAHLDIVDARENKKLYMMHLCIFPKIWDTAPIYGFDIIAGPNKVTGAFLDYSPAGDKNHPLVHWFAKEVQDLEWSKPRTLPEWARNIFSPRMVAAGNINTEEELDVILNLSKKALLNYLNTVYLYWPYETYEEKVKKYDYSEQQNYYCKNQKLNPHTPRVMESLGYDTQTVRKFIEECLFPEV